LLGGLGESTGRERHYHGANGGGDKSFDKFHND
jgi:hypothetical protein